MRLISLDELRGHESLALPSTDEQECFLAQGLTLDTIGRPLHPWANTLPDAQCVLGKGTFYHWGPNKTVDPIVITNEAHPKILLIRRKDTGEWALPGGFVDAGESATQAAGRELNEETSLLLEHAQWQTCYHGPVVDPRSTLNAWPETTAVVTQISTGLAPIASDDALHAEWILMEDVSSMELYGSHKELIDHALCYL